MQTDALTMQADALTMQADALTMQADALTRLTQNTSQTLIPSFSKTLREPVLRA